MHEQEERESCNTRQGALVSRTPGCLQGTIGPAHLTLGILLGKVDIHFFPYTISIRDIQLVPPGGPGLLCGCKADESLSVMPRYRKFFLGSLQHPPQW